MATGALVCGLLGLALLPAAIVALVLGIVVLAQNRPGRGMAIAGVVLGGLGVLVMPAAILFPVFARAREKAQQSNCLSNVKQLALAQMMYAMDYDEVMVPASAWPTNLQPYVKNTHVFACPADRRKEKHRAGEGPDSLPLSYTMSEAMGGIPVSDVAAPAETAMLYDGTQVSGDRQAADYRHRKNLSVGFCDGHAKLLSRESFESVQLTPAGSTGNAPSAPPPPW